MPYGEDGSYGLGWLLRCSRKSNKQISRPTLPWLPLREGRTWGAFFKSVSAPVCVAGVVARLFAPARLFLTKLSPTGHGGSVEWIAPKIGLVPTMLKLVEACAYVDWLKAQQRG